jgi:hypothetical protein
MSGNVRRLQGGAELQRAFEILLACPSCRDMAQAAIDLAQRVNTDTRINVMPCLECRQAFEAGRQPGTTH